MSRAASPSPAAEGFEVSEARSLEGGENESEHMRSQTVQRILRGRGRVLFQSEFEVPERLSYAVSNFTHQSRIETLRIPIESWAGSSPGLSTYARSEVRV